MFRYEPKRKIYWILQLRIQMKKLLPQKWPLNHLKNLPKNKTSPIVFYCKSQKSFHHPKAEQNGSHPWSQLCQRENLRLFWNPNKSLRTGLKKPTVWFRWSNKNIRYQPVNFYQSWLRRIKRRWHLTLKKLSANVSVKS